MNNPLTPGSSSSQCAETEHSSAGEIDWGLGTLWETDKREDGIGRDKKKVTDVL